MPNPFETSFVPQQPLLKVEAASRPREPLNVPLVISLVVFFVSLAVAGGAYLYRDSVNKQVVSKGEQLTAAEKLFDIEKINIYKNLQVTLTTAKSLVDNHTIFSLMLDFLEARTAENIGLTSLNFSQSDGPTFLSVTGQAPTYEAAYFQIEKWRESRPIVKNLDVASIALEETSGIINFAVKMEIDPQTLGYARMLAASARSAPIIAPTTSEMPAASKDATSTQGAIVKDRSTASSTPKP